MRSWTKKVCWSWCRWRKGGRGWDDGAAEVPLVAKRAARVRSAWGTKNLVPVRSARISSEMVDCCGEECAT